jgi:hypothetical protein
VVLHDISPDSLGHRKLKSNRSCKITEDEDRPEEIIEEPSVDQLLEGRVLSAHGLSVFNVYNFWPCGDLANLVFFRFRIARTENTLPPQFISRYFVGSLRSRIHKPMVDKQRGIKILKMSPCINIKTSHFFLKMYFFFQQSDFLQKALNHAKCVGDQRLRHGMLVLMWHKVKDTVSAITALTEKASER